MRSLVRVGPRGVDALLAPLPPALALCALARQSELRVPAKLVLLAGGDAAIQAEIPSAHDALDAERARRLARGAARAAWLAWAGGREPHEPAGAAVAPDALEEMLANGPFPWRRDGAAFRVDVEHAGVIRHVRLETSPTALRAVANGAVPLRVPDALAALTRFALEANRSLFLARCSVAARDGAVAALVWDAVLPTALPLALVCELIEAVAAARALTERALRALATTRLAALYLEFRAENRPQHEGRST